MTIDLLIQIVVTASLLAIAYYSEQSINQMSECTLLRIRIAFHLVAWGSIAGAIWIMAGSVPHWPSALVAPGVALLLSGQRACPKICAAIRNKARRDPARRRTDQSLPGIP